MWATCRIVGEKTSSGLTTTTIAGVMPEIGVTAALSAGTVAPFAWWSEQL